MAIGLHFTAPAIAQTPYDGVWNVTVETRAGSCEPSVRYPVTVSDGKISGADIPGNVGRDGHVRASIGGARSLAGNIGLAQPRTRSPVHIEHRRCAVRTRVSQGQRRRKT